MGGWRRSFGAGPSGDGAHARVLRGGSWDNNPRNLRSANRNRNHPTNRNNNVGLRVALRKTPRHATTARDRSSTHPRKRRVFPVSEGCDFVGYRIWPDHRLLRRHSGYRFRRRYRRLMGRFRRGELGARELRGRVASWIGHARHADTWGLRRSILGS